MFAKLGYFIFHKHRQVFYNYQKVFYTGISKNSIKTNEMGNCIIYSPNIFLLREYIFIEFLYEIDCGKIQMLQIFFCIFFFGLLYDWNFKEKKKKKKKKKIETVKRLKLIVKCAHKKVHSLIITKIFTIDENQDVASITA